METITHIFSDIDGVLTNGTVQIDENGGERKNICYRDLDAVSVGRKFGLKFYFVTGENSKLARQIVQKFNADGAEYGAKDKGAAFDKLKRELNLSPNAICYIGDSQRDIPAIVKSGFGVSPVDAPDEVKRVADFVTKCKGGAGVLWEVVAKITDERKTTNDEEK